MSSITLFDGSMKLTIYHDSLVGGFEDDICLCFVEDCPKEETVFHNDETNLYITPEQAALIVLELNRAIEAKMALGVD